MPLNTSQRSLLRNEWLAELRATLSLGAPLVLTNLAQIALTTTDVIILGRLGPDALAAGALGVNLYFALQIFAIGLVSATAPLMAETFGRGRHVVRDVRRTFRQGIWSAVIVTLPCWVVLWHSEAVMLLFGQDAKLAADAQLFARAIQWGFLPFLCFIGLRSFVAARQRPMWALLVTALAILFNVAANWVLVFGHLGFPALGLIGSGLSTALSNTFLMVGLGLVVAFNPRFRRYHLFGNWWRPDWPRFVKLWKLGVPIGATMMFEVTVFNAAIFLMGSFGIAAVAAHAIVIQIASATFMVPMGLAQAATVRVGHAYGAHDRDAIMRAGWSAFVLAIAFMALMSLAMTVAPQLFIGAFIDMTTAVNAAVVDTARAFLICAAVFQIADGAQVMGAGMLRGLQDTRKPMLYAALGYWGFGMPLCLLFAFGLKLGGVGIWIGLATSLVVVACMMLQRWARRDRLGLLPAI